MKEQYLDKVGNILKKTREEKGLSVDYVASVLKINPDYIRGLEEFRQELFPAPVFFKGFLKNYANFLDLNAEELVSIYLSLITGDDKRAGVSKNTDTSVPSKTKRKDLIKYVVVFGFFAIIIFSWLRVSYINYQKKSELEKRLATNFNTMTTAKELALQEEKNKILAVAKKEDVVKVRTNDNCWIEVKYDNNKIFQGLLLSGEEREFSYKKGMIFKVGNAAAVEMTVKGEVRKDLGRKGEVKEIVIE
ncbi:MAG: DUF4115 domain-containing protein [bacterium]